MDAGLLAFSERNGEAGYVRLSCGRGEKCHAGNEKPVVFAHPDEKAEGWMLARYTDSMGVSVSLPLCPKCAEEYREIAEKQAEEMAQWAEKGLI